MVLALSLLIIGLDNTILNVALPTLERDLGASSSQLQWIVDSYMLVFAGLLLTAGALGDRFGRKRALTFGLVVFVVSWQFIPFHSLLYQAGVRQIPQSMYEAATLDGAGTVRPRISPVRRAGTPVPLGCGPRRVGDHVRRVQPAHPDAHPPAHLAAAADAADRGVQQRPAPPRPRVVRGARGALTCGRGVCSAH